MLYKPNDLCILKRLIAFFICVFLSFPFLYGQNRTFHLAVISAYHESAPWVQRLFTEVTTCLSYQKDIWIDPIYMNSSFITDQKSLDRTIDGVFEHFNNKKPDCLLLFGGMTVTLRERIAREWGDIPIVLVSKSNVFGPDEYYFTREVPDNIDDRLRPVDELIAQYPNLTIVEYPDLYAPTVDMMVQMQPRLKKIIILADASYHNRHVTNQAARYISRKYPQIEYEWLICKEENVSRIRSYLTGHNPELGLLLCSWYYGRIGSSGFPEILSGDISSVPAIKQPMFTLRESHLQDGAVGGFFSDFSQVSQTIVSTIINTITDSVQKNAGLVLPQVPVSHPIVNYAQMINTNLEKKLCPRNTIFINEPLSFWGKYKRQTIFAVITLIIVSAIAFILLRNRIQKQHIHFLTRYNTLLENMPVGYTQASILFGADRNVTDIAYHSSNRYFAQILAENAISGKPDKIFPAPYISSQVTKLLHSRHAQKFTYHFKDSDRYINFILCFTSTNLASKKPVAPKSQIEVELFAIDVTEQNNAETELHNLTDKLELTLNLAHIIPWRWDLRKREITCDAHSFSRNIDPLNRQKFTFNTTTSLHEDDFFERLHPEDKSKVINLRSELLQKKVSYVKAELRIYPAAGADTTQLEWLEINATIVDNDEDGNPTALAGSLLIITKRKKQEQALISARKQAQESDRMKSAFLANMSHEIRTPLNAIVGFSGLLSKTDDPQKKTKYTDLIESNNNLLLQLISDVLDLAKVESNTLEFFYQAVDLNELMNNIEQSIRFKVKPNVQLKCTLGAENCMIETDPNRLSQLINNLLSNSCKFTTQGSIEFGYELQQNNLYFFVKDTGIGISFENQQKLFQRFSKLNSFAQGTGLGLSICKGIVTTMGGCIGAVSAGEGKGSKFWFTIPFKANNEQQAVAKHNAPVAASVPNSDVTVMVAEDNESNYLLFQSILEPKYKLVHAWDGREAVDLFKKHNPQAILMDIGMPNMDGYEATREIRKISETVPILAVTAFAFASDKERVLANGFNGYIAKPINADNLLKELDTLLGKQQS